MAQLSDVLAPHRVWAEIDLDSLVYNYRAAAGHCGGSKVMPVIKADAYGHGAVMAARALSEAGAELLAVATAGEALELRNNGITEPILLLGDTPREAVAALDGQNMILTVNSLERALQYRACLREERVRLHAKLDTGMRRLGLPASDVSGTARVLGDIAEIPGVELCGVFTHLAAADDAAECEFTELQLSRFEHVLRTFGAGRRNMPHAHCANSAGILYHPGSHMDLVRPGIMLYGYPPGEGSPLTLRPVMSLRARVVQLTAVAAGESVGYGRTWKAGRESIVATVSIGYADGLMRGLSGRMDMLVRGRRAPQIGRICMDMCMVDVTDVPDVRLGDAATVFGVDGEDRITAQEPADTLGTIPYEILCAVSKRVPRVYLKGGALL